jgi:hypothetical protein
VVKVYDAAWAETRVLNRTLRDSTADSSVRCMGNPPSVHGIRSEHARDVGRTYLTERRKYSAIDSCDWDSLLRCIAAALELVQHPSRPPTADPLDPINQAIAEEGECTRASEQDNTQRLAAGREFPPLLPPE